MSGAGTPRRPPLSPGAEVVFENGDCQVVDFNDRVHRPGFYSLLDFADGRKVDHVRLVARAVSADARLALLLRK